MGGYWIARGVAAVVFLLAATVLPRGTTAGVVALLAGLVGLLATVGSLAGGPGEQAGAWREQERLERFRPPQGDWPPYRESERPPLDESD